MSFATPQTDHATPVSSATPTRHSSSQSQGGVTPAASSSHAGPAHYDLTSPSDYLNESAFTYTEPNTPYSHYTHGADAGFLPMQTNGEGSSSLSHQQWSHEPPNLHHPQPVVSHHGALTDDYGLNFDEFGRIHSPGEDGHVTPPALSVPEDDSTPVVSDKQAPIPSSSLPQPPASAYASSSSLGPDYTTNASHRNHVSPDLLMSPFQPMADQNQQYPDQFDFMPMHQQQQTPAFIDPSTFQHQQQHQAAAAAASGYHFNPQQGMPAYPAYYPSGSPFDMAATNGFMPHQSMPMNMPPPPAFAGGHIPHDPRSGVWPAYGPARSRGPSPTSSISSSAVSLVRTLSTNSDVHGTTQRSRPKVKLSWHDKAEIVKLSKSNKTMRQEDIAKLYGVDRSTISKIVMQADRWINPQAIPPPAPRAPRPHNGRHPAVEEQMNLWMDEAIAANRDVRDPVLKKEAMRIADELGFPPGRFKASAKWIDKFKERRLNLGKPVHSPMLNGGAVVYAPPPLVPAFPSAYGPAFPTGQRPQSSATTYSSSGSSAHDAYQLSPNPGSATGFMPATAHQSLVANPLGMTRSESDLTQTTMTPGARSRSQSSPQQMGDVGGATTPSEGRPAKIPRPSPMGLQRQESYHGTSRSPRRPAGLTRANSIAGPGGSSRRNRPGSLGASVFGFSQITATPLGSGSAGGSPSLHSPANSIGSSVGSHFGGAGGGQHSRTRSDVPGLTPIASGISGMTISPDSEESGHIMPTQGVVPLTPATPGGTTVPSHPAVSEFGMAAPSQHQSYAATMPNKHYAPAQNSTNPAYGYTGAVAGQGPYSPYLQAYSQPTSNLTSPQDPQNPVWQ